MDSNIFDAFIEASNACFVMIWLLFCFHIPPKKTTQKFDLSHYKYPVFFVLLGILFFINYYFTHKIQGICFTLNVILFFGVIYFIRQSFKQTDTILKKIEYNIQKQKELSFVLKNAEQEKNNFLILMNHEMRTPIHGIVGYTDLLETTTLSKDQKEFLNFISVSTENLIKLIDEVLDFPQIILKKIHLNNTPFCIEDVIDGVLDVVTPKSFEKSVDIIHFVDSQIPKYLLGDGKRLGQVLLNFLQNALKFTDEGHVFLRARLVRVHEGKAVISCDVQDTGIGIPKHLLPSLFSAFSETNPTHSHRHHRYESTGLGLFICKQIIHAMHGHIGVDTNHKKGARFFIEVEFPIAVQEKFETKTLPIDSASNPTLTCLFISSNTDFQSVLTAYFKEWNWTLSVEPSLFEIPKKLKQKKFDVIIIDLSRSQDIIHLFYMKKDLQIEDIPILACVNLGHKDLLKLDHLVHKKMTKPIKKEKLRQGLLQLSQKPDPAGLIQKTAFYEASVSNTALATPSPAPSASILIVEDNIINQKVLSAFLKKSGYVVYTADNGAQAVSAVAKNRINLIFMDLQMPILDGFEATLQILKTPNPPKIIALTANVIEQEKARCFQVGMVDYLTKPVHLEHLVQIIKKWFPQ